MNVFGRSRTFWAGREIGFEPRWHEGVEGHEVEKHNQLAFSAHRLIAFCGSGYYR